jgi:glutathione S-transferase
MKLYYSPGACSLSPHIVLKEAGYTFTAERVDLKTHRTSSGAQLKSVSAKDYVPILELDNGERLTEGPAIVQYLADQRPDSKLAQPAGSFERYRLQEWLNFITTELHKSFYPLFHRDATSTEWQKAMEAKIAAKFDFVSAQLGNRDYLFGEQFTIADAYLFTVLNWTLFVEIDLARWPVLAQYHARVAGRPKVKDALRDEGLLRAEAA